MHQLLLVRISMKGGGEGGTWGSSIIAEKKFYSSNNIMKISKEFQIVVDH